MLKFIMGALGLTAGLFALMMGLGGAGGGHGWIGALWFSVPLVILYPLVLIRAVASSWKSSDMDILILCVAGPLDLLLAANMAAEQQYVLKLWSFDASGMILWLSLWAGWQVVGLTTVLRKWRAGLRSKAAAS